MLPISFSIPECKIISNIPNKKKILAHIIPGNLETYIFNNEKDYYQDYQDSIFGITCKKGGWDCLRHYEILANGCIPLFLKLKDCPEKTLTHLPKNLLNEAYNLYEENKDEKDLNYEIFTDISNKILNYTKENLTTKCMAKYILENSNKKDAKNILFLSEYLKPDYLRCLTLHGFKDLFGKSCHDYPCIEHLYTDISENEAKKLYGKGITYTRLLNKKEFRNENLDDTILEDIKSKKYDLIIYGSLSRGMPFLEIIQKIYDKNEIIFLFGEDTTFDYKYNYLIEKGYKVFVREI